ncbi:unnamed protein product [Pleuronectes platessa]|uniref:Uncharacterized protein n=1 Tax=Pleuronectes platessa TaxID=8262 RepID=A0A9N7U4J8_PLEPL|nr:unnamed protein product [Pleuronectes platessa]
MEQAGYDFITVLFSLKLETVQRLFGMKGEGQARECGSEAGQAKRRRRETRGLIIKQSMCAISRMTLQGARPGAAHHLTCSSLTHHLQDIYPGRAPSHRQFLHDITVSVEPQLEPMFLECKMKKKLKSQGGRGEEERCFRLKNKLERDKSEFEALRVGRPSVVSCPQPWINSLLPPEPQIEHHYSGCNGKAQETGFKRLSCLNQPKVEELKKQSKIM